jgi:lantibiotic modifying enzyme
MATTLTECVQFASGEYSRPLSHDALLQRIDDIVGRLITVCAGTRPMWLCNSVGRPTGSREVYVGTAGVLVCLARYVTACHQGAGLELSDAAENAMRGLISDLVPHTQHRPDPSRGVTALTGQSSIALAVIEALAALPLRSPDEDTLVHKLVAGLGSLGATVAGTALAGINEALYGRAGYLLLLKRLLAVPNISVDRDAVQRVAGEVAAAILADGRGGRVEGWPLMWSFHRVEYLGPAHGVSGVLYALLCWWDVVATSDRRDVVATLNALVRATSGDYTPTRRGEQPSEADEECVRWCHGAPGHVMLFAKAHAVLGDEKYLRAMHHECDIIERQGMLRKGVGLCHGSSGNAYGLLAAYRHTQEERYLIAASAMARLSTAAAYTEAVATYDDPQRLRPGAPDVPDSLMEGAAGEAHFLLDLLAPLSSAFPGFEAAASPAPRN